MEGKCKHEWVHDWIETTVDGLMKQIIYCIKCEETKQ